MHFLIGFINIMRIFLNVIFALDKRGVPQFVIGSVQHLFKAVMGDFKMKLETYHILFINKCLVFAYF